MRAGKVVWIETDSDWLIVRIFRSKAAMLREISPDNPGRLRQIRYVHAVEALRRRLYLRSRGCCDFCGSVVTESSGHMHEKKHRGKGGEISMENSVFICAACHKDAHKERSPRWKKRGENHVL